MTDPAFAGRIALVTGAGRGIGRAVARALAAGGAHVVATSRTQGALEETDDLIRAAGGAATLLPLDLTDGAQVDAVGPSLFQRFGRLDILVHGAAELGKLTPVPHILDRDWTELIAVNVTAGLRLIRTTAPLLTRADAGRAVFLTDTVAGAPRAYWGLYGATKAALAHLARTWAEEVRTTPLRVHLHDPGPTATRLRRMAYPGEDPVGLPSSDDAARPILELCR